MATVKIIKFAAFRNSDGDARDDEVYGIARVEDHTVLFWGSCGETLHTQFTSYYTANAKFSEKTNPNRKDDVFTIIMNEKMREVLFPNLAEAIYNSIHP